MGIHVLAGSKLTVNPEGGSRPRGRAARHAPGRQRFRFDLRRTGATHGRSKQNEVTTTRFARTTDASGVEDGAMGDDDDGSSRRSPLDRSPRSPASRLGNARIASARSRAPP